MAEKRPFTIIHKGELDLAGLHDLLLYAAERGLCSEIFPTIEPTSPQASLKTIISPNNYLGREHYEEHARLEGLPGRRAAWAFNSCIDVRTRSFDSIGTIQPREGLIVKTREEIGLAPYQASKYMETVSRFYARHAIQAGSLVNLASNIELRTVSDQFLHSLILRIESQFETTPYQST